jgi:uncharacterized repeat protein (TIGR01451 family)
MSKQEQSPYARLILFLITLALISLVALVVVSAASEEPALPAASGPAAAVDQADPTTLEVSIVSSPWATLDNNDPAGEGTRPVPQVFVVQAIVTNTGTSIAENLTVTLDYDDPSGNWVLLDGEDPVREFREPLAADEATSVYWFATYTPIVGASYQYTVTADAANADPVSTSDNGYGLPGPDTTVQTIGALNTGSTGVLKVAADVVVGAAFTVTVDFDLSTKPEQLIFSPVGNLDFDSSTYRLLATEVNLYDSGGALIDTLLDRLYVPEGSVPTQARKALVVYTFVATAPGDTRLCPYTSVEKGDVYKYGNDYCTADTTIGITSTVSLSLTKQVNAVDIRQGESLTYTITYTNNGDQPLGNVWIWDDIDPAIGSIASASGTPAELSDQQVAWYVGGVDKAGDAQSTGTLTFTIDVDGGGSDIPDQTRAVNNAFFGIDPGSVPAEAALTSTVTTTVLAPTITVVKTDGLEEVNAGGELTYTLRITNSGSVTATDILVTDLLPDGVSYTGDTTWTPDPIPPNGGTWTVDIPVTVSPILPDGTILTNIMTATYENEAGWPFDPETATDETTISAPFWILTKSDNPGTVIAGETLTYTIVYYHNGVETAENVDITDTLPIDVTYGGIVSQPTGWDEPVYDPGPPATLTWYTPTLTAGTSDAMVFTVTVNSDALGLITNEAVITSTTPATYTTTSEDTTVETEADLEISKADDPDPVTAGTALTYTIQVTNNGPSDASGVTVTDTLPTDITFDSYSASQGTFDDATGVWSVGSLADGASASLTLSVTVNADAPATLLNSVEVAGDEPDPIPGNNTTSEDTTVETEADLEISKADDPDPVTAGTALTYTIQVTNNGPSDASGVTVTDTLPTDITFDSYSASQGTFDDATGVWSVGSLADGASASLSLFVTVNPDAQATLLNSVEVAGDDADPTPGNNTTSEDTAVEAEADLEISKADDPDPVAAGATLAYTLVYTNNGPSDAQNAVIVDTMDDNITYDSVVSAPPVWGTPTYDPGPPATLTWDAATIGAGDSGTIVFTVIVNADTIGAVENNVTIASETPDENLANNTDDETTSIGDPTRATIYGYVFDDANCNGVWDDGEASISGAVINLSGPEEQGPYTTVTDEPYFFIVQTPGVYRVLESDDDGYFSTTPNKVHVAVDLGNSYRVDFGDTQGAECAAIYGTVFEDLDSNTLWDELELGIKDVTITLNDSAATATGDYGNYTFPTTTAGPHTVVETDPAGYMSTTPNEVTVDVALGNGYEVNFGDISFCTCPPDSYEEDDAWTDAVELGLGLNLSQTHDFCDDATDWTKFTAKAGWIYTMTTSSWGQRADTFLYLYGTDGQTLLAASDDYEGTDDYSTRIVWQPRITGVYYLAATNRAGLTGCETDYDLWIEPLERGHIYMPVIMRNYPAPAASQQNQKQVPAQDSASAPTDLADDVTPAEPESVLSPTGIITHTCPDGYEIDDTWELAKPIDDGDLQVHSFDSNPVLWAADKDFVSFSIEAERTITFTVPVITGTATLLELYDQNGDALNVTGTDELIWMSPANGRYYLSVSPRLAAFGCADVAGYELMAEMSPIEKIYLPIVLRAW